MCEPPVRDLVRAMATRASWSAIADAVNEMKRTQWARSITEPYVGDAEIIK
jgi:hypothetical protein